MTANPAASGAQAAPSVDDDDAVQPEAHPKLGTIILLGSLTAIGALSIDLYLPTLPAIGRDFAVTAATVQATMAAFFVGMAAGGLVYGPVSDRFGRRPALLAGILIYIAASIGCAFAPTIGWLIVGRFVQALGACAGQVIARAVVRDRYHHQDSARIFSLLTLVLGVAPMIAPTVGAWLVTFASWRVIFAVLAAAGCIIGTAVTTRLTESRSAATAAQAAGESVVASFGALLRQRRLIGYLLAGALNGATLFTYIASAPDLLKILRRIEDRGALETAHRALQNIGQVFRYAIATGRAERDPTPDLRGALAPWRPVHFASITEPVKVGELLRAMEKLRAGLVVKSALLLAPLLFVRPGELRQAEWTEIDLDAAQWNIPAARMKMREPHLVPLSAQAVAILRDLYALTGRGRHVFPGRTDKTAMSNNAVRLALRRIGYGKDEMSGHGFRAMARTILDEVLHVRPDYIEHQLAHAVRDPNGRAYNRTAHLPARREMMQQWADYLDALKAGGNVSHAQAMAETPRLHRSQ